MFDELLKKVGLKYDDLNEGERETLQNWLEQVSKREVTLIDVKAHIHAMKESVENELVNTEEFIHLFLFKIANRKQILLKARLKNYLQLEVFLDTPAKAKKALEMQLSGLKKGGNK